MNIYLKNETDFVHNGLGFLKDALNASVTDNLNGDYSLFFEYKINGQLSEHLQNENIIKCQVADGTKQLFVIKNINKTFDSIQVTAKHIFYQLLDNFIEDASPTNLSCPTFLTWILDKTNYKHSFKSYSDISAIKSARYVRRNPVDCILGNTDNSMINLFGGELRRDNFNIYFNKQIGNDNGVKLIIGKNITGINITTDTNSVHTRIMPQGFNGLLLPEKYVDSPLINNYPYPRIYKAEFSEIKYNPDDENSYKTEEEAYEALRTATKSLFDAGIDKPIINVKVNWIELSKTNEYKNFSSLERINIGDVITIELLGISYKSKVIKTIYNPLNDKIESFEIGTPKPNIVNSTNNIKNEIEKINVDDFLQDATDTATSLINNALKGHIYKTQGELFIMDTDDPLTATELWRWNLSGLGHSKSGINGPYEIAMTMDGSINASFITSGILRAIGAHFKDVTINGGKIILEDLGEQDPSIIFKKKNVDLKDFEYGLDLSGAILFQNLWEYIKENPIRIETIKPLGFVIITDNKYRINYNNKALNTPSGYTMGYEGELYISKSDDSSIHETIYKGSYSYGAEDIISEEINIKEYQLPNDFGRIISFSDGTATKPSNDQIANFLKKEIIDEKQTTYSSSGIFSNIYSTNKYNSDDLRKVIDYLLNNKTLSEKEFEFLDANNDGKINVQDVLRIIKDGGDLNISEQFPGRLVIDYTNPRKTIRLVDCDDNIIASLGIDGLFVMTKDNYFSNKHLINVGEVFSYKNNSLETECGTWIDGKKIYRLILDLPSWDTDDYSILREVYLPDGITIDTLIKLDGYVYNNNNCWCPINFPYNEGKMAINAYYSSNSNQIHINSHWAISKGYVIVEYTKVEEVSL